MSATRLSLQGSVLVVTLIVTNWQNKGKLNIMSNSLFTNLKDTGTLTQIKCVFAGYIHSNCGNQKSNVSKVLHMNFQLYILKQKLISIIWIIPFVGSFVGYNDPFNNQDFKSLSH